MIGATCRGGVKKASSKLVGMLIKSLAPSHRFTVVYQNARDKQDVYCLASAGRFGNRCLLVQLLPDT